MIIIGLILIAAGIVFPLYMVRKLKDKNREMQYIETTSVKDACELLDSMKGVDDSYRHYVEMKGVAKSDQPLIAPFSNAKCVYYETDVYTVNEVTETHTDNDGNTTRTTKKQENKISSDKSPASVYLDDGQCDTKINVDLLSFGSKLELKQSCDRMSNNYNGPTDKSIRTNTYNSYGSKFLGYRLVERIMPYDSQLYILGELYSVAGQYTIGKAIDNKKVSLASFKTEEEIVKSNENNSKLCIAGGAVAAVIGVVLIIMSVAN